MIRVFIRSLIRSTIDSCMLPGLTSGSEILWIYLVEWRKEISALAIAILPILFSQLTLMDYKEAEGAQQQKTENTH